MAEEVIEQTPAEVQTPAGEPSAQTPSTPAPTQVAVPANNGWEAEKRAFIADLQKERRARQQFETQATTHKAELELERRRIQALTGIQPRSPQDQEAEEVRSRFKQVIPREQLLEMLGLDDDDIKSLKGSKAQQQQLADMTTQQWDRHGREMMGAFQKEILAELGGDKLTDRQTRSLISTFVQACNDDPELKTRYERGDTTVFKQFTQEWVEDWLKPAQRKAQAAAVGQARAVPQGKDRSITVSPTKKIDVTDDKAVADFLEQGYRDRGGRFRSNE